MNQFSFILRGMIFLILLLLFFNPSIKIPLVFKKPVLLIAVDCSKSMEREEKIKKVEKILKKLKNLKKFNIEFYSFADTVVPGILKEYGKRTNFNKLLKILEEKSPDAGVIISDGFHNQGEFNSSLLEVINFPLYTVGITDERYTDIGIVDYSKAESSDSLYLSIYVESKGINAQNIPLKIFLQSKTVEKLIDVYDGEITKVDFTLPKKEAKEKVKIEIPVLSKEKIVTNNTLSIYLKKRKKRVLYFNTIPYQGTAGWIKILSSLTDCEVYYVIFLSRGKMISIKNDRITKVNIGGKFDLIVLDNFDATKIPSFWLKFLKTHLKKNGVFLLTGDKMKAEVLGILVKRITVRGNTINSCGVGDAIFSEMIAELRNRDSVVVYYTSQIGQEMIKAGDKKIAGFYGKAFIVGIKELWNTDYFRKGRIKEMVEYAMDPERLLKPKRMRRKYMIGEIAEILLKGRIPTSESLKVIVNKKSKVKKIVSKDEVILKIDLKESGHYKVRIYAGNTIIGKVEFEVFPFSVEDKDYGINRRLLKDIAEETGGEYKENGLPSIHCRNKEIVLHPREEFLWYMVVMILFMGDLLLRRRKGLP